MHVAADANARTDSRSAGTAGVLAFKCTHSTVVFIVDGHIANALAFHGRDRQPHGAVYRLIQAPDGVMIAPADRLPCPWLLDNLSARQSMDSFDSVYKKAAEVLRESCIGAVYSRGACDGACKHASIDENLCKKRLWYHQSRSRRPSNTPWASP